MLERLTQGWRSDDQIMEALGSIGASPLRDDKPAANDLAFIKLAAIRVWLRAYELP
jgi:hypothetical protein